MKKERNIVLLPTDKASTIGMQKDNHLWLLPIPKEKSSIFQPQHLYITSDEEIKEGDWVLFNGKVYKSQGGINTEADNRAINIVKVISTTDESLTPNGVTEFGKEANIFTLPKPSPDFITRFVEEYNKGNVIDKVLVEYQELKEVASAKMVYDYLKLNYDNTINISLPKEVRGRVTDNWDSEKGGFVINENKERMYSREEVEKLCENAFDEGSFREMDSDEWIKENLK